ncbi:hypothetical protein RN001_006450 [Aquatica leii]|uniref:Uncharacterized protein n=1 Tax=Aquatica leii TaxID=1421715 RepID=A0AAN7PL48_9COLE|nr:hypothetical protein RN001_006450 [Aquatica leii]
MNVCRLCLYKTHEESFLSIWDSDEDLPAKILNCVSIEVTKDDNLPTTVCVSCVQQITNWEKFRNECHKSNELLLKASVEELQEDKVTIYILNEGLVSIEEKSTKKLKRCKLKLREEQTEIYLRSVPDKSDDYKDDIDYLESGFLDYTFKNSFVENSYQCTICSEEFNDCFEYLDHQDTHDGQPVFQCDKCSDVFSSRKELVEHDRNHRTSCPHCGKLILKTSMNLHLIKHTDKFKCDQCDGRFNSNASLSQHTITVHTDIKDHICETCGKRFSSQTAMRVHIKSHSDKRLYPCKLCNYAGRTASAIYVHMSTHANDLCVCEICSKTFKSTRNLNDHLRRSHTKEKKHQCTYCDKKFVDKYMLSVHIRCHTGVRPYRCTYCQKSFIRSDGLKEHMATHGQRVLHECKSCGYLLDFKLYSTMQPIILVHGGAGQINNNANVPKILQGVKEAVKEGHRILTSSNGNVVDAVEAAVRIMESNEVFNAGFGSVLNLEGEVEMDASIMVGSDLSAGAVTVVKNIEYPISLARLVMEKTTHVLLAAEGAVKFAKSQGVPILPDGSMVSENRLKEWEEENKKQTTPVKCPEENKSGGTVGAVAVDANGHVATATSTGGRDNKLAGRSSDTCMIGSGTYADDNIGAVSTTGHGETIAKFCLAHAILKEMETGKDAQEATSYCIKKMTERLKNTAGAITISNKGDVGVSFSTNRMSWAYIKNNELHYGIDHNQDDVDPL